MVPGSTMEPDGCNVSQNYKTLRKQCFSLIFMAKLLLVPYGFHCGTRWYQLHLYYMLLTFNKVQIGQRVKLNLDRVKNSPSKLALSIQSFSVPKNLLFEDQCKQFSFFVDVMGLERNQNENMFSFW